MRGSNKGEVIATRRYRGTVRPPHAHRRAQRSLRPTQSLLLPRGSSPGGTPRSRPPSDLAREPSASAAPRCHLCLHQPPPRPVHPFHAPFPSRPAGCSRHRLPVSAHQTQHRATSQPCPAVERPAHPDRSPQPAASPLPPTRAGALARCAPRDPAVQDARVVSGKPGEPGHRNIGRSVVTTYLRWVFW